MAINKPNCSNLIDKRVHQHKSTNIRIYTSTGGRCVEEGVDFLTIFPGYGSVLNYYSICGRMRGTVSGELIKNCEFV
jgi:hypothetical protein